MKTKLLLTAALLIGLSTVAQAIPITGTVRQSGQVTLNTMSLATATSATFTNPAASVEDGTGSFLGTETIGGPDVTWMNFSWAALPGPQVNNLWSFTRGTLTYSFDLSSITNVTRIDATDLLLKGLGTLRITGVGSTFDPTPANWSFTITDTSAGTAGTFDFGFADSNTATLTSVPDEGMTVLLLGLVLSGLALVRRRLKA
jgi:hypothetical protein